MLYDLLLEQLAYTTYTPTILQNLDVTGYSCPLCSIGNLKHSLLDYLQGNLENDFIEVILNKTIDYLLAPCTYFITCSPESYEGDFSRRPLRGRALSRDARDFINYIISRSPRSSRDSATTSAAPTRS
ncbi:hypothetical protein EVAR_41160_1 [Eumeta japonica]|uniref:Uncharacterized protein n=1 Tax=Eumeta variegata TaxID=151549 RepID=A0A4C1YC45_EUMVA|nr:hypothetical protein EVAR_41160_1 [Eumeta japonica]